MSDNDLAAMAAKLSLSPDYRVLRRLQQRQVEQAGADEGKTGLILDVETTGLDSAKDEVIELGMVKFRYGPDGNVAQVIGTFSALNEPSIPIPADIADLTGITDDMVAGQRIDAQAVADFTSDAAIVIAHKANFDRKFSERYWPVFASKAWACSLTEIPWRMLGFDASALSYLLAGCGFFHDSHRSTDDCFALLEVLASRLPKSGRTALSLLLEQARKDTPRIWAKDSPFELKDKLKARKYRWNDGGDGRPKSWFIDVAADKFDEEIKFLKDEIYRRDFTPHSEVISAINRHSKRA